MAAATRFLIEDEPNRPFAGPTELAPIARRAASVLSWVEFALLLPSKLLGAIGWLAVPLFVFAIVPVVLLGSLVLAQAPVFFLLWKLFGPRYAAADRAGDVLADDNRSA